MTDTCIRKVKLEDAKQICDIYNHYVVNTVISFEEEAVSEEELGRRISSVTRSYPWIVCSVAGQIKGYAYASSWKERSAYRHTAEVAIYVEKGELGKGLGTKLLERLLEELRAMDIHVAMAVIALPNEKSVGLHEKFGFRKVAHFTEVGYKKGSWIDVGYWELAMGTSPIGQYINNFSGRTKVKLDEMWRIVKAEASGASEKISYQMPTYFLYGNLVHFAGFGNHIGFYPTSSGIEAFKDELGAYKHAKGSVQFPLDKPLPDDLIRRIVRFRVEENTRKENDRKKKKHS